MLRRIKAQSLVSLPSIVTGVSAVPVHAEWYPAEHVRAPSPETVFSVGCSATTCASVNVRRKALRRNAERHFANNRSASSRGSARKPAVAMSSVEVSARFDRGTTLSANRKLMDKLKERLLESETVDASELQKLVFEYSADSTVPMATI